jgi:hypothetical protein
MLDISTESMKIQQTDHALFCQTHISQLHNSPLLFYMRTIGLLDSSPDPSVDIMSARSGIDDAIEAVARA